MDGMARMQAKLERLQREAPAAMAQAVKHVAMDVLGRAVQNAPLETGHLRESGSVTFSGQVVAHSAKGGGIQDVAAPPTPTGNGVTAVVGFNATTADGKYSYALIQHEDTTFAHSPPIRRYYKGGTRMGRLGGGAKYLEKAVNEVADGFERAMNEDFQKLLGRLT